MKRINKTIALLCVIAFLLTSVLNIGTVPVSAADTHIGNTVVFDGSGVCTDDLANFDNVFEYGGIVTDSSDSESYAGDSTRVKKDPDDPGDGYLVYNAGEGESFNSISIDAGGFNKWDASVYNSVHLAVYAAVYSDTSGIVVGPQIELDCEIAAESISKKDIAAFRFISKSIPDNTQYLVIKLPDSTFQITKVRLESAGGDSIKLTKYFEDGFDVVSGLGSNAPVPDSEIYTNIKKYDADHFGNYNGDDTLIAAQAGVTGTLTYHMDFNIKYFYISTYDSFEAGRVKDNIRISASSDGVTYTRLSVAPSYPVAYDQWQTYPNIYRSGSIPRNTRFLKVEFEVSWGEPRLGRVVIRGVDPAEDINMVERTDNLDNLNYIYDSSANIRFDHNPGDQWFNYAGDSSRIRRSKNEPAYVVYRTTGDIKSFEAQVHTYYDTNNVCMPEDIKAYVSADGTDFSTEIPLTRTPGTGPADPSVNTYIFTNAAEIPDGYRFIKITITGNVWDGSTPQIGYVKLGGFAPFDFDPLSQRTVSDEFAEGLKTAASYSNNLELAGEPVEGYDFAGDTTRIMRAQGDTGDIVLAYRTTTDIRSVSAELHNYYKASEGSVPNDVRIEASADGITYKSSGITVNKDKIPDAEAGWQKVTYTASDIPSGTTYVRFTIPGSSGVSPQIGKISLAGVDQGDKQFNIIPGTVEVPRLGTTTIKKAELPVKIDGIVETDETGIPAGDWESAEPVDIAGVTDGNGDLHNAKVYFKYDYDNLYIGVKIKDPTPMKNTNTGNNLWAGDNIELFMGTEDINYIEQPGKTGTMLPSDKQLVLSGGIVDNKCQYYLMSDGSFTYPPIMMEVKKDADGKGYTIEASVSLDILGISNPWDEKQILLSAVLNDGDYASRGQWGWTTNGEADKKKRGMWGLATFEKADAPQDEVTVNAAVDNDTQVVTITGNTVNVQGKFVTVLVNDPAGKISYIDQAVSDEAGNYEFSYVLNTDETGNGVYLVTVGGEGISRTNSGTFEFTFNPDSPIDMTAPREVSNLRVTAGDKRLAIEWTDPEDSDYKQSIISINGQKPIIVEKGVQKAEITGLTNGCEYTLLIYTVDMAGNISDGVEAKGTPRAPSGGTGNTGGAGNTGGTGGNEDVGGTGDPGRIEIGIEDIQPDQNGRFVIKVTEEVNNIILPVEAASKINDGMLDIESDRLNISIPSALFEEIADLASSKGLENARIAINIGEADGDLVENAIRNTAVSAGIKVASKVSRIDMLLVSEDGEKEELSGFAGMVKLSMAYDDSNVDEELLGLYRYNDNTGKWDYIGGKIDESGNTVVSDANIEGIYAVLEYNKTFKDLPEKHWANHAVKVLAARHIVNGVSETEFDPDRTITRGEFAVLLSNMLGLKAQGNTTFIDVDQNRYYAGAIAALHEVGLVNGVGGNRFAPEADISREEMVTLIVRAFEYKTGSKLSAGGGEFADSAEIAGWALEYVNAAKNSGLVKGVGGNMFAPKSSSKRSETAMIIYNLLKLMEQD